MDYGYGGYSGGYGFGDYSGYGGGAPAEGGGFYGGDAGMGGYDNAATTSVHGDAPSSSPARRGLSQGCLIPLTISQYLKAIAAGKDGEVAVDGKELKTANFRLVGRVIAIEERSTQWAFTIDDSTGRMDVSLWIDLEENEFIASRRASWMTDVYVCVIAKLSVMGTETVAQALDVRTITDYNEVTHHYLDCVFSHLFNTKGPLDAPPQPVGGYGKQGTGSVQQTAGLPSSFGGGYGGGFHATSYGAPPPAFGQPGPSSAGYGYGGGYDTGMDSSGFNQAQKLVLEAFQAGSNTEHGFSIDEVTRRVAAHGISSGDVKKAAEFLSLEGHLYATKDEAHFKSTT